MTLTISQLYRELADAMEEKEGLKTRIAELEAQVMDLSAKVPEEKRWLNNAEAAKYIGRSVGFLNKDRLDHDDQGQPKSPAIPFRKDGYRSVLYAKEDLEAYLEGRKRKGKVK